MRCERRKKETQKGRDRGKGGWRWERGREERGERGERRKRKRKEEGEVDERWRWKEVDRLGRTQKHKDQSTVMQTSTSLVHASSSSSDETTNMKMRTHDR